MNRCAELRRLLSLLLLLLFPSKVLLLLLVNECVVCVLSFFTSMGLICWIFAWCDFISSVILIHFRLLFWSLHSSPFHIALWRCLLFNWVNYFIARVANEWFRAMVRWKVLSDFRWFTNLLQFMPMTYISPEWPDWRLFIEKWPQFSNETGGWCEHYIRMFRMTEWMEVKMLMDPDKINMNLNR